MNTHQRRQGFTIVELLIVIVVIAILAAITIVAYNGVQQRARNAERVADINAIQKAVELYYVDHGEYPKQGPIVGVDQTDFPVTALGLPRSAIVAPGAPEGTLNSIKESNYGNSMDVSTYGYRASRDTGSCWDGTHTCVGYRIYYRLEGESVMRYVTGGKF